MLKGLGLLSLLALGCSDPAGAHADVSGQGGAHPPASAMTGGMATGGAAGQGHGSGGQSVRADPFVSTKARAVEVCPRIDAPVQTPDQFRGLGIELAEANGVVLAGVNGLVAVSDGVVVGSYESSQSLTRHEVHHVRVDPFQVTTLWSQITDVHTVWHVAGRRLWLAGDWPLQHVDLDDPGEPEEVTPSFWAPFIAARESDLALIGADGVYVWRDGEADPSRVASLVYSDVLFPVVSAPAPQAVWYAFSSGGFSGPYQVRRVDAEGRDEVMATTWSCCLLGTPLVVPSQQGDVAYVATTAETGGYAVQRISAQIGATPWIQGALVDTAVDRDFLYWIEDDAVWKRRHCGGPAALVAEELSEPRFVAVDGRSLWVLGGADKAELYRVSLP